MARFVTQCPVAPTVELLPEKNLDTHFPGLISRKWLIDVITPLFGGGVEAGENDPITIVRPPTIRGQLRFWWRATRGLSFSDVQELRRREAEIWGAAADEKSSRSPVLVEVTLVNGGHLVDAAQFQKDPSLSYAMFSFQKNNKQATPSRKGREGVSFELTLRYPPSLASEVAPALWAWLNFGGIGARTRRGLGALACAPFAPKLADRNGAWFQSFWRVFKLPAAGQRRWPTLGPLPLLSKNISSAREAWARPVGVMRDFRQGYGTGRNSGPGRSFWPEADSLRILTGKGEPHHFPSITVADPAFPRAQLGLPIVFQFKSPGDSPNNCDMVPGTPDEKLSRMASPFILRPLRLATGEHVAMILRLEAEKPTEVTLKQSGNPPPILGHGTATDIEHPSLRAYPHSPLSASPAGSAVEAFVAFARTRL